MQIFLFNLILGLAFGFILTAVRNGGSFILISLVQMAQDGWNALCHVVARAFFARSNLPQSDESHLTGDCFTRCGTLVRNDMADDDSAMARWNTDFFA